MEINRTQNHRKWCVIFAEHLSHYRLGVYSLLDANAEWSFTYVAGPDTRSGTIVGIPQGALSDMRAVRNIRFGQLSWQCGVLGMSIAHRPDVALFVGDANFVSTWVAAAIFRLKRVRVFFWTIGWHRPEHGVKRVIRLLFYRLANRLLLYGPDGAAIGASMGYPASRMEIIGNSYESCSWRVGRAMPSSQRPLLQGTAEEYVGAVTRITPEKRFDLLIEAVGLLRSKGREISVMLVGEGGERSRLEEQAASVGVPLIIREPIYDQSSLREVYSHISATVLPERAGLAVIQSLSHGTPAVSVDDPYRQVPEFRAIKTGTTGYLYAAGSVPDLARAIEQCVDMVSRAPTQVSGDCKQEVIDNWSPEGHAERILKALADDPQGSVR